MLNRGLGFLLSLSLSLSVIHTGSAYADSAETDFTAEHDTQIEETSDISVSETAEQYIETVTALPSSVTDGKWFESIKDGDSYDIEVKMLKWPYSEPPAFSMGNGALTGAARLVKEDGSVYAEVDFKAIDMGSAVGHLTDFWYIENQNEAVDNDTVTAALAAKGIDAEEVMVSRFLDECAAKCEYIYDNQNKYIAYIRIPLENNIEKLVCGLESDFSAMGRQLCVLNFDYTNAIEQITGQKLEKTKVVDTPIISSVLSAEGGSFEISIKIPNTSESSDAVIYYMVGGSDDEDLSQLINEENKYSGYFTVSKEETEKWGGIFSVYAVGVKEGYNNSVINVKKMTFELEPSPAPYPTASPEASSAPSPSPTADASKNDNQSGGNDDVNPVTKNGRYRVGIALYNASSNQLSMGNVAFENNREAIITTSGGKSVIRMATNPVSIPPYYSAVKEVQFENKSGQWQQVKAVKRAEIMANDGSKEHKLNYLQLFEFELPDIEDEYVPVRISVPYTPMDAAVDSDGGYIEARIKINWKSLEKTDSKDELIPDDEAAAGSSKYVSSGDKEEKDSSEAVDKADKATGIRVTADKFVFPSKTVFSFRSYDSGKEYDDAGTVLTDSVNSFRLYSVTAKSGKEAVEPTGFAKLYFPVGDDDTSKTVIYRITEETKTTKAGKTQIEHEISEDGKYYIISVKTLGIFAVGQSDKVSVTPKPEKTPVPYNEQEKAADFVDIDGHWAASVIREAAEIGLFEGVGNRHFAPELDMTRGMFVTVLGRLKDIPYNTQTHTSFTDVNETDYFAPYASWAADGGIMNGTSETEFSPDIHITREQMAVVISNFALHENITLPKVEETEIKDYDAVSAWAKAGVAKAVGSGIMTLNEDGGFLPQNYMSRAELAVLIMEFVNNYMPERKDGFLE